MNEEKTQNSELKNLPAKYLSTLSYTTLHCSRNIQALCAPNPSVSLALCTSIPQQNLCHLSLPDPEKRHPFNISVQSPEWKNTFRELLLFHKSCLLIWWAIMFEFKMNPSNIENAIIKDTIAQVRKKTVLLCIIILLLKMLSNPLTYTCFHLLLHNHQEVLKVDLYELLFRLCIDGLKEQLKPDVKPCEVDWEW